MTQSRTPPGRKPKQTDEPDNHDDAPTSETPEPYQIITSAQLEKLLNEHQKKTEASIKATIKNELKELKEEISKLRSELETVENIASNANKLSEALQKEVSQLKEINTNLQAKINNNNNEHEKTLEVIEDTKNRQLRKTLVFKGIPEQKIADEKNPNPDGSPRMRPENWDDTAVILAESMAKTMETTVEAARNMVERCHRAAENPRYKGTAPRPIFAAFVDWRDSEKAKDEYRKINFTKRDSVVFCEQKYGPRTTVRRNTAMKERKRLIETNTIISGYVSHPARLMVKDSNAKGAKYKLWRDFSKEPVKFDR